MSNPSIELPVSRTEYGLMSGEEKVQVAFLGYESLKSQIDISALDDSQLAERIAETTGCDFESGILVALSIRHPDDF